jgi:hypothetical protein
VIDYVRILWQREPARIVAALASLVVFAAAKVGLVVDEQSVGSALLLVLPILLGGEATRAKVSPIVGPVGPNNDYLLDFPPAGNTGPDPIGTLEDTA